MKEINYEFRKRYSIVHRDDRRDYMKKCPDGDLPSGHKYDDQ